MPSCELHFSQGKSNKFWRATWNDRQLEITFGRMGARGQTQTKTFPTAAAAKQEYEKLIAQKQRKGYVAAAAKPSPSEADRSPQYWRAFNAKRMNETPLSTQQIGQLKLMSGDVVVVDPSTLVVGVGVAPLERRLPAGNYPVLLAVASFASRSGKADKRVAAAMLQIEDKTPVEWEPATFRGAAKLKKGLLPCYGVDGGWGCFMDADLVPLMLQAKAKAHARDDWSGGETLNAIAKQFAKHDPGWGKVAPDGGRGANIIAFHAGLGDGCYTSWWGLDERQQPTCLITDFMVFEA
jgi:predicted DNA-binding WGR domain protein